MDSTLALIIRKPETMLCSLDYQQLSSWLPRQIHKAFLQNCNFVTREKQLCNMKMS